MSSLGKLGGMIAAGAATRATSRSGVVVEAVDSTHALVDIGDRTVICLMPTSLGVIAAGQAVRVAVEANGYTILSIIAGASPGSFWTGQLAAGYTPSSNSYKSMLASTFVQGSGAPDFAPTFDSDCLIVPFPAWWRIFWKVYWGTDSTSGNRQAAVYLNPSAMTWNSSANLSGGSYLDTAKSAASTAETVTVADCRKWLTPTDRVMLIARTTSATNILPGFHETRMTLELLRTIP